ncbi:MAG: type-F conjugative transfer system secretin TraK [Alphaproteobacteria bacterium]|nr:type-F conjugative transfer system secretin TraK [Alphaproteobacteria bacterium]
MNIKLLPFFFLSTAANAAIIKPLDSLRTIEIPIAKEGLTRIAVQEDRILNVFGVTGEYVLEADEDHGQIFIQPANLGTSKPLSLTITTERGHTQDLRLVPKDQVPEALILESREEEIDRKHLPYENSKFLKRQLPSLSPSQLLLSPTAHPHSSISRHEIEELLQACRQEKIPIGYKLVPVDWKKSISRNSQTSGKHYKNGLQPISTNDDHQSEDAKNFPMAPLLMRELRGEKLQGLTYELKNTTETSLILSEAEFIKSLDLERSSIIAILITKKVLVPGERTSAYVVAQSLE